MAKTRLIDIARAVGVSEATVSRALNGKDGVNEETRSAILRAARRSGREVEAAVDGRPAIGVLVPDVDNPVFAAWLDRIELELFQRGAEALVAMRARTPQGESDAFGRFLRAGASGIIVVSGFHSQQHGEVGHYRDLIQQGLPMCLINGVRQDLEATFLTTDDAEAVHLVVQHLRELGHERIGIAVGDEHTWPVRQKVHGFERLLGPAGAISYTDFSYAGGYQAARELLDHGCTALLCGSDVMAAGAIEGSRAVGRSVPGDVSVVGYDDVQWAPLTSPALTTVRQAIPEMSRSAVRAVLERGESSRRSAHSEVAVRPQLIVRGSTAAAPR